MFRRGRRQELRRPPLSARVPHYGGRHAVQAPRDNQRFSQRCSRRIDPSQMRSSSNLFLQGQENSIPASRNIDFTYLAYVFAIPDDNHKHAA